MTNDRLSAPSSHESPRVLRQGVPQEIGLDPDKLAAVVAGVGARSGSMCRAPGAVVLVDSAHPLVGRTAPRLRPISAYASWSHQARRFLEGAAEGGAIQSLPYTAYDALQARDEGSKIKRNIDLRLPESWTPRPNPSSFLAFERSIFPRIEASGIPQELVTNMQRHMYIDWLLANVYMPSEVCDEAWFAATGLWQSVWVLVDDNFEVTGTDLRDRLRSAFMQGIETGDVYCDLMAEGIRDLGSIMEPGSRALADRLGAEMLAWFEHVSVERRLTLQYRETGRLPDFETYSMLRAGTVATPGCVYAQLPFHRHMLFDDDFQTLCFYALALFGLSNDLVSHHKNRPAQLVDALIVLAGGPTVSDDHVRLLVDIINQYIDCFDAVAKRSRLDDHVVQSLRNWASGCIHWGLKFDRYSSVIPIADGRVEVRCCCS